MERATSPEAGFTLVELMVTVIVFSLVAIGFLGLFTSLIDSAIVAKHKAVASALATNQMEYLKSLPYDSLAVQGGSIYAQNPLPATSASTLNGIKYTITTNISYVDDAYDGCGPYPNLSLKELYCRNYPPPNNAPPTDLNPADYKIIHVQVTDPGGTVLATEDTEIAARVSETASATGALFVSVIDGTGTPVSGATVTVTNSAVSPAVNVSDSSDSNGITIFYGLPPDSNTDYVITATKSGYSTLTTIAPSGSLQPTYPNQKILTQQASYATLTIKPQGTDSLLIEAVDTAGNPLPNMKIYVKGGYKKYTSTSDTSYYYDNITPTDTRPTTDSSGLAALQNLVPGSYIFCGDSGATSCQIGATTYYLAAAVPYTSDNPFNPITIPIDDPSSPPSTTYAYNGGSYLQKVRLIFTTNASYPRINTVSPGTESLSSTDIGSFAFAVSGTNLPCTGSPNTCGTTVALIQGSNTFTASCTGPSGNQLSCTVDLSAASVGNTQLTVTANGNTFTLPVSPPIGGVIVTQ